VPIKRFYRISIWLPVLVPLAAGVISAVLIRVLGTPPGVVGVTLQFVASLIFFGVPYIPFALLATWWIRKADEYEIRRVMFLMPILMTAVACVLCVVMMMISNRVSLWLEVAVLAATVILLVGYGWVLITLLLRRMIRPIGTESA